MCDVNIKQEEYSLEKNPEKKQKKTQFNGIKREEKRMEKFLY